jgi:hypothetical protein
MHEGLTPDRTFLGVAPKFDPHDPHADEHGLGTCRGCPLSNLRPTQGGRDSSPQSAILGQLPSQAELPRLDFLIFDPIQRC